jgi:hypothetical protein
VQKIDTYLIENRLRLQATESPKVYRARRWSYSWSYRSHPLPRSTHHSLERERRTEKGYGLKSYFYVKVHGSPSNNASEQARLNKHEQVEYPIVTDPSALNASESASRKFC